MHYAPFQLMQNSNTNQSITWLPKTPPLIFPPAGPCLCAWVHAQAPTCIWWCCCCCMTLKCRAGLCPWAPLWVVMACAPPWGGSMGIWWPYVSWGCGVPEVGGAPWVWLSWGPVGAGPARCCTGEAEGCGLLCCCVEGGKLGCPWWDIWLGWWCVCWGWWWVWAGWAIVWVRAWAGMWAGIGCWATAKKHAPALCHHPKDKHYWPPVPPPQSKHP